MHRQCARSALLVHHCELKGHLTRGSAETERKTRQRLARRKESPFEVKALEGDYATTERSGEKRND